MASRAEKEMTDLRCSLEKALASTSSENESIKDIISALNQLPISIDLLKATKIGQTLQEVKKKFASEDVGILSKNLLSKWKRECAEVSTNGITKSDSSNSISKSDSVENKETKKKLVRSVSGSTEPDLDDSQSDEHFNQLPPMRKTIMDMFATCFKLNANEQISKFLAYNVESSINQAFPAQRDQKAYINKAKSLAFNLKKNERLRLEIIDGTLQAEHLPHLTSSELATDELRDARVETSKAATLARRGDLYEITRSEILSANGIDPNKGGEFKCRKCKCTRTTHYALQTRSSDEPMTVFVCCLGCGNRWRCT